MTNGNDYSGAIESAKQLHTLGKRLYNFYVGEKLPKDPQALIDLAKKVKKEEALRQEAKIAKEYIETTLKNRKKEEKMERRAKLKRLFGKKD